MWDKVGLEQVTKRRGGEWEEQREKPTLMFQKTVSVQLGVFAESFLLLSIVARGVRAA